ncbi:alcohol oxidase-like protein [Trametes maxima]|nr:alcohol oxidase-like protein [Trametes maxima]
MAPNPQNYDIIIAGGGASGCVLAGRLAAADPSLSILVIESGPTTRDDPLHTQPSRYMYHLRPDTTTVKFVVGRESAALGGRAPTVPIGQCLGGGSSVNFSMYARAAASDYDDWATVYDNKGWGSAELLPLLKKCETYQVRPGRSTHGYSGPLKVSHGGYFPEVGQEFLNVAAQYDRTRATTDDMNNLFECNQYGRWQKWIDAITGKRSDVPHHYVYPQSHNRNLLILTGYHVKKVMLSNGVATGVEYIANRRFHPEPHQTLRAYARQLVVLSAGTFGSPAILERSGIGAKAILDRICVPQKVDLPGVGENYQDHQSIRTPYIADASMTTLDKIMEGDEDEIQGWTRQWAENGTGLLATNGIEAGIKLRPTKKDLDAIGEGFRKRWLEYYAPAPDKPVLLTADTKRPGGRYYSIGWYLQHPTSTGYVHATHADDVDAPLDFHPGYVDSPEDMLLHKWSYKRTREYARRLKSYRGEVATSHPSFSPTSEAVACERSGPVPVLAPDLEYSAEDDKILEEYIRKTVGTAFHPIGTCAMKKRDIGGVVDSRLNVYGVQKLKVVDVSICPGNVAANTYSTAVVIGEKAAVMIGQELGIDIPTDDGFDSVFHARL